MQFGTLTWRELSERVQFPVVIPLGSLEQHGHHLPVLTDTMIVTELAQRVETQMGTEVLVLPPLWLGASHHHRAFPGTVSVNNDLYGRLIADILEGLIEDGFRKIFLLNAHGGNILPAKQAIYEVQLRHRTVPALWLALGNWMELAGEQIASLAMLHQKHVTHACELETSMILRLRPELVHPELAQGANIPFDSAFYVPDFSRSSRVYIGRTFEQLSKSGAFGHPEQASEAKGEALFAVATQEIVLFLREFGRWASLDPA
jgi:creatinine amidohydrolase